MHADAALRQHNPAFWTTAERLHEVFSQLERHLGSSQRSLAVLRQVQALEAEFEAEVTTRSGRMALA